MKQIKLFLSKRHLLVFVSAVACAIFLFQGREALAQGQKARLFLSPTTGSFLADSTFEVGIIVDTDGEQINAVKTDLKFPTDKLQVVKPSAGGSFISIWIEQPSYSNKEGTLSFMGGI